MLVQNVNRRINLTVLFSILLIYINSTSYCNNKEDLLKEQERLRKEIQLTNKLIEENRKKVENSLSELRLIENKLEKRTKLIENFILQIEQIDREMQKNEITLIALNNELEIKKKEYATIIYEGYKRYSNQQEFMYLLASSSLNQFYSRVKYLQQVSENRKKKIELIKALEIVINGKVKELEKDKRIKTEKLDMLKQEREFLSSEKIKSNEIIDYLTDEKNKLNEDLKKKKRLEKEVASRIKAIILEESKRNKYSVLTPEQKLIANDFASNQGKLPWPTAQGIITESFGEHSHPILKGIKIRNNGIDITAPKNSDIRSVFKGIVTKIFTVKGSNYTVIIRHGNFYTVYNNLSVVYVNTGDNVETKQIIGLLDINEDFGNTTLHFELWKDLQKLNPEEWISK